MSESERTTGYYASEFEPVPGRVSARKQQISQFDLNDNTAYNKTAAKFRSRGVRHKAPVRQFTGTRARLVQGEASFAEPGDTSSDEDSTQATGDKVVSNAVAPSTPEDFLHLRRLARANYLNTLLLAVMTATVVIIAAYLGQDSDTVDVMAERINGYFDIVDELGAEDLALRFKRLATDSLDFYEQDALPAIRASVRVLNAVRNETDVEAQLVAAVDIPQHLAHIADKVEQIVDRLGQLVNLQSP